MTIKSKNKVNKMTLIDDKYQPLHLSTNLLNICRVCLCCLLLAVIPACGDKGDDSANPKNTDSIQANSQELPKPEKPVNNPVKEANKPATVNNNDVNLNSVDDIINDLAIESNQLKQPAVNARNDVKGSDKNPFYDNDKTLAIFISKALKVLFNEKTNHYGLDDNEEKCLGKLDYRFAVNDVNIILKQQLSVEEFNNLTDFVATNDRRMLNEYTEWLLDGYYRRGWKYKDQLSVERPVSRSQHTLFKDLKKNKALHVPFKNRVIAKYKACGIERKPRFF